MRRRGVLHAAHQPETREPRTPNRTFCVWKRRKKCMTKCRYATDKLTSMVNKTLPTWHAETWNLKMDVLLNWTSCLLLYTLMWLMSYKGRLLCGLHAIILECDGRRIYYTWNLWNVCHLYTTSAGTTLSQSHHSGHGHNRHSYWLFSAEIFKEFVCWAETNESKDPLVQSIYCLLIGCLTVLKSCLCFLQVLCQHTLHQKAKADFSHLNSIQTNKQTKQKPITQYWQLTSPKENKKK